MALTTVPASLSATALTLTTAAQPNITSVGTLTGLTVSGVIGGSAGSASAPSLSFSGDTNTGFYSSAADNIGFAIGGVARAFMSATQFNMTGNIVASGNLGGTLTTAAQANITSVGTLTALTVSGDAVFTPDNDGVRITGTNYATLRLEENDTTDVNTSLFNSGGDFVITTSSDNRSSTTDRFRLDHATGDIGFYNTAGSSQSFFWDASAGSLTISGDFLTSSGLKVAGHPVVGYGTITGGYSANLGSTGSSTLNETHIYSGGTLRAVFDGSGNLGIGSDNPIAKLHVRGTSTTDARLLIEADSDTAGGEAKLQFKTDSQDADTRIKAAIIFKRDNPGTRGTGDLHFAVEGNNSDTNASTSHTKLIIQSDGNVGIGTTSPTAILDVVGPAARPTSLAEVDTASTARFRSDSSNADSLYIAEASSGALIQVNDGATNSSTAKPLALQPFGGNVGIGNAPTDGVLHVHTASAGTVTASTQADDIVIENNAEGGMTIITPDDQSARIRFTSPSTNNAVGGATIFYRQNINKMNIGTEVSGGILALHSGAGSETMRLDGSGNVNIGAKDYHTHNSGVDSLQIGYAFNLYEDSYSTGTENYAVWANNSYYSASGGNKYMRNDEASRIMQANGTFTFQNAAAGTADNAVTFVDRMIIDSGGTTLVGGVTNTAGGYQFKVGHSNNQGEVGIYADSNGADFLSYDRTNGHYNDLKIHAASTYFTRGNQPVHIGSTSPEFRVNQMLTLTSAGARGGMSINSYHNSAAGPLLDFNISRNVSPGSHTVIQDGDALGTLIFRGDDGDEFKDAAAIEANVDASPGNDDMAGRLVFYTAPDGSTGLQERMRIDNQGRVTKPNQIFFEVYRSGAQTGYNAVNNYAHVVIYNSSQNNIGGHYNTSTGFFTAPITGVYYFLATAYTAFTCGQAWFSNSGGGRIQGTDMVMDGMGQFPAAWTVIKLSANDTIGFHPYSSNTTSGTINANANHTYFRGYLLG